MNALERPMLCLAMACSLARRPSGGACFALGCALVVGLKLWLVVQDEVLARAVPHDQQRYAEMAFELIQGRWLGEYGHMTLIREPAYPLWVALVHGTGIPLRLAAEGLLAAAALLFAAALVGAGLPPALALACFAIVVLQPHSLLVNRELLPAGFYLPLLLCALAGLLMAARAEGRRRLAHAAWTGLALGVLWTTRPEKPLLVAVVAGFALLDVAARRARGAPWRLALGPAALVAAVAALGIGTVSATLAGINYRHYGAFLTSDLSAPGFAAANAALLAIEHDSPRRFVLVPRDVRQRAYAVSPAFRELRPTVEAPSWAASVSCVLVRVCDDLAGAWFMWTLREAAAEAGHMGSAAESDAFFQRIADELGEATARGALPPPRATFGFLHPYPGIYAPYLWTSLRRVARRIGMPGDGPDWDPPRDQASTPVELRQLFDQVANRREGLTSAGPVTVAGWALAERDPIARISLRRARPRGAAGPAAPAGSLELAGKESGALPGAPNQRLSFRFAIEKATGAFRSMEPSIEFTRESGATTALPLPEAGGWAERDGIRLTVVEIAEGESGSAPRRGVRKALWIGHALLVRAVTLVGCLAAVALLIPPWRGRLAEPVYAVLGLVAVVVVARVAMLSAIDASSFPTWSSRYVYAAVSLYSCGMLLLIYAAVRHLRGRGLR
jgi:hypothetical protein